MSAIEFKQFTCLRDSHCLFNPLSVTVPKGTLLQITGPNGAGKTTLLRAISGLYEHWQGQYLWDGQPIAQCAYERASNLLYLGHQPGVKGALTPRENLAWYIGLRGGDNTKALMALAEVGLRGYEDTPCHQLSAGQQRRVALARLYFSTAQVWVLDEPFTAIDAEGVSRLEAQLGAQVGRGGIVFITSHQAVSCAGLKTLALKPFVGGQ